MNKGLDMCLLLKSAEAVHHKCQTYLWDSFLNDNRYLLIFSILNKKLFHISLLTGF